MVERVWGAIPNPGGAPFGEIWWLWDDGESSSPLFNASGEPCALVLRDLAPGPGPFPMMIKTLHPAEMLSLQVHPGKGHGKVSKAETWIFLEAGANSFAYTGIKPGVTPCLFEEAVKAGQAESLLLKRNVERGDLVHIPPGTVHCLCGGVVVLEVQQNCDITYRIWDWGRVGTGGKPRETHLAQALPSIDYSVDAGSFGLVPVCGSAGYTIEAVIGGTTQMPPLSSIFIPGHAADVSGCRPKAPCCLVADRDGGEIQLESVGWLAVPVSEEKP